MSGDDNRNLGAPSIFSGGTANYYFAPTAEGQSLKRPPDNSE